LKLVVNATKVNYDSIMQQTVHQLNYLQHYSLILPC